MVIISILEPLIKFITDIIYLLGYPGIFLLSLLESALIPIPSEIVIPFAGFLVSEGKLDLIGVVLAGTFGNLAGSIIAYLLGKRINNLFITKYGKYLLINKKHIELTEKVFQRHGDKLVFIGRLLPAIRTYISLPAGVGKTKFFKFVVFTFVGSLIWNLMLAYVGLILGDNWKEIDRYSIIIDILAIIGFVLIIIWFIRSREVKEI